MMRWIITTSMQLRYLVMILAAVLLVYGIVQLRTMPVDVYPEFDPPLVEVQTEALGLSAAEVESLITVPTEADLLNGVAWLDQIYSESVAGMSSILLLFEPETDPIRARQMVQERLTQAHALPNVSKPPVMLQPLSSSNRVMMVGLSSPELSLIELGVLARWNIKPRLLGVPGVANIALWGQRERQLQVRVDPAQLQAKGVTLEQVIETAGDALWVSPLSYLESSTPGTAGFIDTPNQRLSIQHELPISTPDELAKVAVAGSDGLLLNDVAQVVEDHQPLIGDAVLNSGPGIMIVIEKFPGANIQEVTRGVEEAFEAMRPGLGGVDIDTTIFRPASYIETATSNLSRLLLISAILLILVLGAFFFNWRTALISLFAIPLSLVAAGLVLHLRGATFNMMVLAGLAIALGIIIDDAITDVDNIARRLRQQPQAGDDSSTMTVVVEAVLEMRSPLVFATLIMLLAVMPLFFLPGLTRLFFQPLAVSYVLAVLASLTVALIVTPALSLTLLADGHSPGESPLVRGLQGIYHRMLSATVRAAYPALIVALVIGAVGLAILLFLKLSVAPSFKQTDLLIQLEAAPGTSHPEMDRVMAQASQELRSIPGVRNVGSHVGRAETGDKIVGINSGELWVSLDPAADYEATVAAIHEVIAGYPGLERDVQTYQPRRTGEALARPDHDLVVRIYGPDLGVLRGKAQEVQQAIAGVSGVVAAQADVQPEEPQVEIEVDLAAAEAHGVKPGDVRRQATTLLSGLQVGNLFEEQKVFDVVVWGVPEIRDSLTDIRQLLIATPRGSVPLAELADVRIVPAPISIQRDAVSRFADVIVTVSGRSLSAVTADIKSRLQSVEFPYEFHAEVLGVSSEQVAAQQRVLGVALAAVLGIFLLLQASYASWRLAFVALLTLPMALAGGVLAVLISGGVLSLGSLCGLLAVLGVAVRNGIVMTSRFQQIEHKEGFGLDSVVRGAGERLGPIAMTTLATGLALLPMVIAGPIAGNEILQPMAVVVLGGLVTATPLTLFILPALYLRFGVSPERSKANVLLVEQPTLSASAD
ncbi:MAG TPA: efflux RND transporter permease subunit [Caldilineaceae bacterium]|nr:efflux RND transporter permease subunit [Caldilineaceae bacterium]